jgi:hypothetical protein
MNGTPVSVIYPEWALAHLATRHKNKTSLTCSNYRVINLIIHIMIHYYRITFSELQSRNSTPRMTQQLRWKIIFRNMRILIPSQSWASQWNPSNWVSNNPFINCLSTRVVSSKFPKTLMWVRTVTSRKLQLVIIQSHSSNTNH